MVRRTSHQKIASISFCSIEHMIAYRHESNFSFHPQIVFQVIMQHLQAFSPFLWQPSFVHKHKARNSPSFSRRFCLSFYCSFENVFYLLAGTSSTTLIVKWNKHRYCPVHFRSRKISASIFRQDTDSKSFRWTRWSHNHNRDLCHQTNKNHIDIFLKPFSWCNPWLQFSMLHQSIHSSLRYFSHVGIKAAKGLKFGLKFPAIIFFSIKSISS